MIQPAPHSLAKIVNQFKSVTTRRIRDLWGCPEGRIWQRGYDEHILRNEAELNRIREYIRDNPRESI